MKCLNAKKKMFNLCDQEQDNEHGPHNQTSLDCMLDKCFSVSFVLERLENCHCPLHPMIDPEPNTEDRPLGQLKLDIIVG